MTGMVGVQIALGMCSGEVEGSFNISYIKGSGEVNIRKTMKVVGSCRVR